MMMCDCCACRKTSRSRTMGTTRLSIRSRRKLPGPTDGSWSMSPTKTSDVVDGTARSRACASGTSIIDASSMIT